MSLDEKLVREPYENTEIPVASLQILRQVELDFGRKEKDTHVNRASAATSCYRKRWFQRNGYEGEPLNPRALLTFAMGDLVEILLKDKILHGCVGPDKIYKEVDFGKETGSFTVQNGKELKIYAQEDLTAKIGSFNISAHADGWALRNDGKWELIEVKSAADFGYDEFKEKDPGDYLKQAMVNLQTDKALKLGAVGVRFFYFRKNTSHIWDRYYPFDINIAREVEEDYRKANQERDPGIPRGMSTTGTIYGPQPETYRRKPTGRMVLKYPCSYCPYKTHCIGDSVKKEFNSYGTPVFVVG